MIVNVTTPVSVHVPDQVVPVGDTTLINKFVVGGASEVMEQPLEGMLMLSAGVSGVVSEGGDSVSDVGTSA